MTSSPEELPWTLTLRPRINKRHLGENRPKTRWTLIVRPWKRLMARASSEWRFGMVPLDSDGVRQTTLDAGSISTYPRTPRCKRMPRISNRRESTATDPIRVYITNNSNGQIRWVHFILVGGRLRKSPVERFEGKVSLKPPQNCWGRVLLRLPKSCPTYLNTPKSDSRRDPTPYKKPYTESQLLSKAQRMTSSSVLTSNGLWITSVIPSSINSRRSSSSA
jgi:hypothetical protein